MNHPLLHQPAPDFKLFDTEKKEVSLSSFHGQPVVLLFFPLAFTGTCTKELCSMRDDIAHYNSISTQVLAVSIDSLFVLGKYKAEHNLNFPLLSDFNREASKAFHTIYDSFIYGMMGVSKRSAFVIDKNGIVQHAEVLENASEIPDFNAVKTALENCR